tara:strand:+ start:370 stop:504 length:135 start_codon:yes stop_codon:yes gene_type:complete
MPAEMNIQNRVDRLFSGLWGRSIKLACLLPAYAIDWHDDITAFL